MAKVSRVFNLQQPRGTLLLWLKGTESYARLKKENDNHLQIKKKYKNHWESLCVLHFLYYPVGTPQVIAPEPEPPGETMDEETLLPSLPQKRFELSEPVPRWHHHHRRHLDPVLELKKVQWIVKSGLCARGCFDRQRMFLATRSTTASRLNQRLFMSTAVNTEPEAGMAPSSRDSPSQRSVRSYCSRASTSAWIVSFVPVGQKESKHTLSA